MKKTAKLLLPVLVLLSAAALLLGLYLTSRPGPSAGTKAVTVTVTHSDGSEKAFHYQTDLTYLGELLLEEGLATGQSGPYGLYIIEVDGEVADYAVNKAYWALFAGKEYATQGADTTPISDGDAFALVYTVG